MESIFVSYSFDERGRELARLVKDLIRTYSIRSVDGEAVGGGALNDKIRQLVDEADGLIAVLTSKNGDKPSDFVKGELDYARAREKKTTALVDEDVQLGGGLWDDYERIELGTGITPAYIKLSRTIGGWRREGGRLVQVAVGPRELADLVDNGDAATCECRLTRQGQVLRKWYKVPLIAEVGGLAAYLNGVPEEALVELRIEVDGQTWKSRALPQWIHAELRKK